jgi:glucose/arabinose dehydrogenase
MRQSHSCAAPQASGLQGSLQIEAVERRLMLASVPAGFTETEVAGGLTGPAALDIAADGRVFFAEQSGTIRVVQDDHLLSAPFADLSTEVDGTGERGMLGIALDPNFNINRYVYVYYTANAPTSHNRLVRLTADPTNPNVMVPGSEKVLLEFPSLGSAIWHMGGSVQFGPDGKLYISVGDHQQPTEAQNLTSVFGKILRVNTDGSIPSDNPFYSQTTGINRAIWALGLRNPYTTAFQPGTGRFFLNDVGQDTWEEIDDGFAGANYGWPGTEGDFTQGSFPTYTRPLYAYQHTATRAAITGGAFYNPLTNQFPAQYVGKYFFFDFGSGEMWTLDPATRAVTTFATGLIFANGMDVSPDGSIYYVTRGADTSGQPSIGTGGVFKIAYSLDVAPSIAQQPQPVLVSINQPATFSVSAAGSSPLSYQWFRGDSEIPDATNRTYTLPSAALSDTGATFRVRITNGTGSILSDPATLTVTTNQTPTATILTPNISATYRAGDMISFSGSGFDPETGNLPASALTWRVDFHHHDHLHPFMPSTSGISSGSFTIPTSGETDPDVWYRIHLTVTDPFGLKQDVYRDVVPVTANLTINTSVPGLQVLLDGQPHTGPFTAPGVVGLMRSLDVPLQQDLNGKSYVFTGWSDGSATDHTFAFPSTDTMLTANFAPLAVAYLSDLTYAQTPTNGWGPPERDRSNGETGPADGRTLTLNGQTYAKGLGTHAASDIRFNVGGQGYTEFRSEIGLDDEVTSVGSVVFQVYVDNVLKYTSPTMTAGSATLPLVVPIAGASQLRLVVTDSGNGNTNDHADWAGARVTNAPPDSASPVASLFKPVAQYPTGTNAHGIYTADLDGDGKLDLAVANAGSNTVSVLMGNGDGTFVAAVNYNVGSEPKSVTGADFNGDGKRDLVTANQGSGDVSVLINNGDGTYAPAVNYTATAGAHEAAVGDLDSDGDIDIAVTGWGSSLVRVLYNQGNGTFNGTNPTYTVGNAPHSIVAIDLNSDTKLDLAIADHDSNNVALLLNAGNGTYLPATFFPVGSLPHSLRTADLNGDRKMDLVTANEGSDNVSVLLGDGAGGFAPAVNYATGLVPKGAAIGDVNGDGKLDLLTADTAGNYPSSNNPGGDQISVLFGNGDGTFGPQNNYTTGRTPFSIALGDFDGDGDLDVASANWHTNDVGVLINNPTTITPPVNPPPTQAPSDIYLSDLTWISMSNGWGPAEKDRSNGESAAGDGKTITLNGVTYPKGLGVHASSDIRYSIPAGYSEFRADIGVDDEVGNSGSAVFQVYVDNVLKYTSPTLTGASATIPLTVPITGATQLRLVVTAAGNGNAFDHADWASARLVVTSGTTITAPAAPTGLSASISGSQVNLSWTDASSNESGFRIDRKTGSAGTWSQIADVSAGTQSYPDTSANVLGATYYYRVYAYNSAGPSGYSNEYNVTIPTQPANPPGPGTTSYLSDLNYVVVSNGWGLPEKDRSNGEAGSADGRTMTLNGQTYTKGIGAHASSEVTFNLAGQYSEFLSDVGVDDEVGSNGSVVFQVWLDGVLAFNSGTMTGASSTQQIDLDVTGKTTLRLVVTDAGNGNAFDHADWAGARLVSDGTVTPPPPPSGQTWLSDLAWIGTPTNGWGPVERDRSNGESGAADGGTISLRGNTYPKGLGVHAASQINYVLNGSYKTFQSDIGIDNETRGNGSVIFQVWADGVLRYDSGIVRGTDAVKSITLDITGVQQLSLIVQNAGDGNNYDHADWAGAKLLA